MVPALGLLLVAATVGWLALRAGPPPAIELRPSLAAIGPRHTVSIEVVEPSRGLGDVAVELVQGERRWELLQLHHEPRPSWGFWRPRTPSVVAEVAIGHALQTDLVEGPATLSITATRAPAWLRRPAPVTERWTLVVDRTPPAITVLSPHIYVTQGGCEAVVYAVDDDASRHGVEVAEWWFPGNPLAPSGDSFALFAAPWDIEDGDRILLVAEDAVGNRLQRPFVDRFTRRPPARETIELPDSFLDRVVPTILPRHAELHPAGERLIDGFLAINGELRRRNRDRLREIAQQSQSRFLWHRPFLSQPGSKVMSSFATERTYRYRGEVVDQQVHLGFDQASTRRAEVPAANDGIVLFAGDLGIYGNVVILDHGYGLGTLYAHLSGIEVDAGEAVDRGQRLGRTGETGLAGGDHLHFAVLLRGLPVDPLEWWDGHWLNDRLARKLGAALGFEEGDASAE